MKINLAFHLEIEFSESGGRVERHRIQVACSPEWSQWWFGVPRQCWCLSTVFYQVTAADQETLDYFMLPSADQLYGDSDFLVQQDFHQPTEPKPLGTGLLTMVLLFLIGQPTNLTWTPKRIYGLLSRGKWETQDQQYRRAEGRYQSNVGFRNTSAVLQADCLHAKLHWCSNSCQMSESIN